MWRPQIANSGDPVEGHVPPQDPGSDPLYSVPLFLWLTCHPSSWTASRRPVLATRCAARNSVCTDSAHARGEHIAPGRAAARPRMLPIIRRERRLRESAPRWRGRCWQGDARVAGRRARDGSAPRRERGRPDPPLLLCLPRAGWSRRVRVLVAAREYPGRPTALVLLGGVCATRGASGSGPRGVPANAGAARLRRELDGCSSSAPHDAERARPHAFLWPVCCSTPVAVSRPCVFALRCAKRPRLPSVRPVT